MTDATMDPGVRYQAAISALERAAEAHETGDRQEMDYWLRCAQVDATLATAPPVLTLVRDLAYPEPITLENDEAEPFGDEDQFRAMLTARMGFVDGDDDLTAGSSMSNDLAAERTEAALAVLDVLALSTLPHKIAARATATVTEHPATALRNMSDIIAGKGSLMPDDGRRAGYADAAMMLRERADRLERGHNGR